MSAKRYCCVIGCKNSEQNSQKLAFYNFPTRNYKIEQRNRWIQAVGRTTIDGKPWQPKRHSRICSEHFVGGKKSDIQNNPSYVPTIFPPIYLNVARYGPLQKPKERLIKPKETVIKPKGLSDAKEDNKNHENYIGMGYEISRPSKRHCSVPNCNTYYSKGISIHRFPIDEKLCEKWRIALGMNKPISKYMCICSKHFLPTDFMPGAANVRARLKRWVVPSRRLPHSEVVSSNGQSLNDAAINIAGMDDDEVLEKAASANESSISVPRKQVKKGVCYNLDTPAISETPEIVPIDDFTDRRVPDLLNESNIEIIYLPEIKEEENNGQSKDCRSLDQQKHPTETCPDQSSRPESILPHGLSPPQDYDPSSEFVPKQMYMELKFNYMDVLRRHGLLEKRMKGCEEECKELRTENYRLTYELQKVKNLHSQMARLAEENEKCESKLFIVTGSKVMSRVNNYHPYDALK